MVAPFAPFDPEGKENPRGRRLREISLRFVLPNLITVLAICAGMSGIRLAFENRFETAVIMVLLAAFLDGIDGRIARMLKASSRFGAQMDSLADVVNFGVAPALVLYAFLLDRANSIGWIACLLFAIACCLRLARFNVMDEDSARVSQPKWHADFFVGVPAPAGAILVLLPVYVGMLGVVPTLAYAYTAAGFTVLIALLMVSRLPVFSGKSSSMRIRRDIVMPLILVIVLYVLFLVSYTWQTMTVSAVCYLLALPFSARAYARKQAAQKVSDGAPEMDE